MITSINLSYFCLPTTRGHHMTLNITLQVNVVDYATNLFETSSFTLLHINTNEYIPVKL